MNSPYFPRGFLRAGQSPQNVGEQSLGYMPNGPTIDNRQLTQSWIGRLWVLRGSHRGRRTPTQYKCGIRDWSCRCRAVGVERGKAGLKRIRRLRVQSRNLRHDGFSALLRGLTTSRNTPAPSRSAGPEPSARLYVRILRFTACAVAIVKFRFFIDSLLCV